MKCFICGTESEICLCDSCRSLQNLELIFDDVVKFKEEKCDNEYIREHALSLENPYLTRELIPDLLSCFRDEDTGYYNCVYLAEARDEKFEDFAVKYLESNNLEEAKSQYILFYLMDSYQKKFDMYTPQIWCDRVEKLNNVLFDTYVKVVEYYSKIGEYDKAQHMLDKAVLVAEGGDSNKFFVHRPENASITIGNLVKDLNRYKTVKPYWPTKEDRQRIMIEIYDSKGIAHPRIKPKKVEECDFTPIKFTYTVDENNFTAFWFDDAFTVSKMKVAYSVAAVKVRDGIAVDRFNSFINPDKNTVAIKDAAKKAGVDTDTIKNAPELDLVMAKFFEFVGDDVLVTSSIGNQRRLLSRGARYNGMSEINNKLFSLDDMAEEMGIEETDRESLLKLFGIKEGSTTLEKAELNITLLKEINEYE